MKKVVSVLLVLCLLLGVCAGCSDRSDPGSTPQQRPSSSEVMDSPSAPPETEGDAAPEPEGDTAPEPEEPAAPESASQPSQSDENTLNFRLGPDGEVKAIRPGDTLGGWTLESWDVKWEEDLNGMPWVDGAEFVAPADAPVELRCTVYLNPMGGADERSYWFDVAEEDYDKMPRIEGATTTHVTFWELDNGALGELEAMGYEDRWDCRVAVSRYVYFYAPRGGVDSADVVRLELE